MSNVIDLGSRRPKDDPVYECKLCGCQKFFLQGGGYVACGECGERHEHLIWGQHFVSDARPDLNKTPPSASSEDGKL